MGISRTWCASLDGDSEAENLRDGSVDFTGVGGGNDAVVEIPIAGTRVTGLAAEPGLTCLLSASHVASRRPSSSIEPKVSLPLLPWEKISLRSC